MIEENILQAEAMLAGCQAALEDPAVVSDAAALQDRLDSLEAAQAEVERLYERWAELEGKQARTTQIL
jgi:ATP-binding cassette subfamily F protein uup